MMRLREGRTIVSQSTGFAGDVLHVDETSLAYFFGNKVGSMRYESLSPKAIEWAKMGILDTIGVTLAGSHEPCATLIADALSLEDSKGKAPRHDQATVWGRNIQCSEFDAAFINGTAAHALDFDDCNNTMGGHPSAPILPALFAIAERAPIFAQDLITAYIAGFEVETKLAMAVNFHHYTKGWHPTATLGVFGAAAACAKLLGLNSDQTATALALAASSAAGLKANFGTMTKPMHVGRSAKEGLMSARLAQKGFSANAQSVFEHQQGFFEVFNGATHYDRQRALDHWARPWDIEEPGIAIKQYPCCGSTHPAIDAAIQIKLDHQYEASQIKAVRVWIHQRRLQHTNRPEPKSELDAKFSLQYVVLRALIDGRVGIHHFEQQSYCEPRILNLLPKIEAAAYDARMFDDANHFAARVELTLTDGRVLESQVLQPHGRTSANPLSTFQLKEKFELCAQRVLTAQGVQLAYEWIEQIEHQSDAGSLGKIFWNHLK
jgi:2-methylcitrate dehydratase PrpD